MRVKDMTDNHVLNTYKMLKRKKPTPLDVFSFPNMRGEMAQECAELAWDMAQSELEEWDY